LTQITSTNLCFGVPKYLQPQTKILLNPISLAIGGIQTTTGDMPYVTASMSQTFTVSDISKMPQLSEWHIYGNEQQGRFSEVGCFLPFLSFKETLKNGEDKRWGS
jgi:hypothetical protein